MSICHTCILHLHNIVPVSYVTLLSLSFFKNCCYYTIQHIIHRKRAYPEDSIKMSTAKKLINDPEHVVDEALEGLLRTNPGVQGIENHRVVVRSDLQNVENRVAILCGGGSGHEPAFAGYVGQGCLSGAIAGSVFASPPPSSILAAILAVASKKPSGILVVSIINNIIGQRVHYLHLVSFIENNDMYSSTVS